MPTWTELLGGYNPHKHEALVLAAQRGLKPRAAAGLARITVTELNAWLQKGAEGVDPFKKLLADIEEAMADRQFNWLDGMHDLTHHPDAKIRMAALKWNLERVEGFGETIQIEAKGPGKGGAGDVPTLDLTKMSREDIFRLATLAAEEMATRGLDDPGQLLIGPGGADGPAR